MTELEATQCERIITQTLQAIQARYERALGDPTDNRFEALDTKLTVDQVRRIVTCASAPSRWTQREGKHCIDPTSIGGGSFLAQYVGRNRHLVADSVLRILTDIAAPDPRITADETTVAIFINLAVVEPHHHPATGLAIWATVAHHLASGRYADDLHKDLPGLMTEHDLLAAELPPNPLFADKLRPAVPPPLRMSVAQLQVHSLVRVRPDLASAVEGLGTDDERSTFFGSFEPELRAYVTTHIYERIAEALRRGLRGFNLALG